jgi:threonine dehydratase
MAGAGTVGSKLEDAPTSHPGHLIGGGGLILAFDRGAISPASAGRVEAELYPSMKNVVEDGHGAIGGDTLAKALRSRNPATRASSLSWSTASTWSRKGHRDSVASGLHRKDGGRGAGAAGWPRSSPSPAVPGAKIGTTCAA